MPKLPFNQESNQVTPKPELEKRTRRKFSMDYKLRIIAEADTCQHGELGALLRRESLYSNQLRDWRAEFRNSGAEGLSKAAPGSKASKAAEQRRIEQLEKENSRLNSKLQTMEDCLELQRKVLRILDHAQDGNERRSPCFKSGQRACPWRQLAMPWASIAAECISGASPRRRVSSRHGHAKRLRSRGRCLNQSAVRCERFC